MLTYVPPLLLLYPSFMPHASCLLTFSHFCRVRARNRDWRLAIQSSRTWITAIQIQKERKSFLESDPDFTRQLSSTLLPKWWADRQPTPSIFTPAPAAIHRDFQVLSEGDDTGFTNDLAQLADLTGRQESESQRSRRLKAERRSKLVEESNREHSRFQFDPSGIERKDKSRNGSMDDLVREIKQMTVKKPDPYVSLYQISAV